jgi:hypothetical protein
MIKGVAAAFAGAIIVGLLVLGIIYIFFIGLIEWLAAILFVGILIGAIIMFFIVFIIFLIMFFAFFYYLAEKKPEIKPGHYKLEDEKGKHEK